MRDAIDFLLHIILAISGAVGFAILMVGGAALGTCCALYGCGRCWKSWRGRR